MHVKKIKKHIGKTGYPVGYPAGYPVSGNLRISESGFSKPGYPVSGFKISIRYKPIFHPFHQLVHKVGL